MKITINQIKKGEDELILNYKYLNEEVSRIISFANGLNMKLIGFKDKEQIMINAENMLYAESVDGRVFLYTDKEVYRINYSLLQLEGILTGGNFFRCSKSMIININHVTSLKSLSSNRIDATMENGEHIIISRTYATSFRKRLKRQG